MLARSFKTMYFFCETIFVITTRIDVFLPFSAASEVLVMISDKVFEVWKASVVFVSRTDENCVLVDIIAAVVVTLLTATLWVVEIVVAAVDDSVLVVVEVVSTSVTADLKLLIMLQYLDYRLQ